MLSNEEIQKYGGKVAILNHMGERIPSLSIPRYVVKSHGDPTKSLKSDFNAMRKPVIVRSSSPYEYGDFEGIFDSVRDVDSFDGLERAVRTVEESAVSNRAKKYAKQNGFSIDGKMHVILQEQSPSIFNGAMMRHPNNPDIIFINYLSGRGANSQDYHSYAHSESGDADNLPDSGFFSKHQVSEQTARLLVEKYKQIEAETDISKDHSLFVEFGLEPFAVYQARPFKKFETADFEVPLESSDDNMESNFAFGITPPEGIVLPVVRSFGVDSAKGVIAYMANRSPKHSFGDAEMILQMNLEQLGFAMGLGAVTDIRGFEKMIAPKIEEWHQVAETQLEGQHYCLITSSAQRDPYDVDLTVPNMSALMIGGTYNFLVHNLMRLFKKSEVTIGRSAIEHSDFFKGLRSIEDKVRIISNGKNAIALKE